MMDCPGRVRRPSGKGVVSELSARAQGRVHEGKDVGGGGGVWPYTHASIASCESIKTRVMRHSADFGFRHVADLPRKYEDKSEEPRAETGWSGKTRPDVEEGRAEKYAASSKNNIKINALSARLAADEIIWRLEILRWTFCTFYFFLDKI